MPAKMINTHKSYLKNSIVITTLINVLIEIVSCVENMPRYKQETVMA